MKVPALSKVESLLLISGVVVVGYLAYRAYSAGSSITSAVSTGLGDAADQVSGLWHSLQLAAAKTRTTVAGAAPSNPDDQADAESARLQRQNAALQQDSMPDLYDPNGNVAPEFDPTRPTIMGLNNEVSQPALAYSPEPFTYS